MSNEPITNILVSNFSEDRPLTESQIQGIFYYLTDHYALKKYLEKICFKKGCSQVGKAASAEYIIPDRIVYIYRESMAQETRTRERDCTLREKRYRKVFINEVIIQILIHEIIHGKHIKTLFESDNYDLEYEVLRGAYYYNFISNVFKLPYLDRYYGTRIEEYYGNRLRKLKKQAVSLDGYLYGSWKDDPSEINAEYEWFKEIIYLNEYINPRLNKNWKTLLYSKTKERYTQKQDRIVSPFERYNKHRNKIVTLDRFYLKNYDIFNLPLDKRLSYGLPISITEYKEMEEYIMSLHL